MSELELDTEIIDPAGCQWVASRGIDILLFVVLHYVCTTRAQNPLLFIHSTILIPNNNISPVNRVSNVNVKKRNNTLETLFFLPLIFWKYLVYDIRGSIFYKKY